MSNMTFPCVKGNSSKVTIFDIIYDDKDYGKQITNKTMTNTLVEFRTLSMF